MGRIEETFARLAHAKRKALVAYLCVGDPSVDESIDLAVACARRRGGRAGARGPVQRSDRGRPRDRTGEPARDRARRRPLGDAPGGEGGARPDLGADRSLRVLQSAVRPRRGARGRRRGRGGGRRAPRRRPAPRGGGATCGGPRPSTISRSCRSSPRPAPPPGSTPPGKPLPPSVVHLLRLGHRGDRLAGGAALARERRSRRGAVRATGVPVVVGFGIDSPKRRAPRLRKRTASWWAPPSSGHRGGEDPRAGAQRTRPGSYRSLTPSAGRFRSLSPGRRDYDRE